MKTKPKKIIGFIGEKDFCKKASDIVHEFGFYKTSIAKKVLEVSKYLMKIDDEEITDEVLLRIRNRGYQVNRLYWINLVLTSVPEDKRYVVIEDLRIEDVIQGVISPFYIITNEKDNDFPSDIEVIKASKNHEEFKETIRNRFKP